MDTRYGRFDSSFCSSARSCYLHQINVMIKPCLLFKQGEKECSYYLKTGQCKFGISCKFHHPQPAGTSLPTSAPQFYQQVQSPTVPLPEQYGGASTSLRVARPPVLPGSYVQGAYGPVLLSSELVFIFPSLSFILFVPWEVIRESLLFILVSSLVVGLQVAVVAVASMVINDRGKVFILFRNTYGLVIRKLN